MPEFQLATIEALRDLTLQLMLISAGVFGIVGGFVSASGKAFSSRWAVGWSLSLLAISALAGYLLHGVLISLLHYGTFDPFDAKLVLLGVAQIGLFVAGGALFTVFVVRNI